MYQDHFGLAINPFGLSPKLEFLFKSEAFEESIAHLLYGVDNSEAIIMITGAIGTGKTMALQSFMTNLNQSFEWALVTNTQVNSTELLKLILDDLGVEFPPGCDKSDLLILFKEFLVKTSRSGQRVMLIIDEAQNMDREVLEEIRLLTNLGQGDVQPVQVILVGQPELEDVVNRPDLAQLRQRIRVHYRLDTLSKKEVGEYLNHRMGVAGCKEPAFKPGAVGRIFEFSGGVPRLVNSLASQALLSAFVAGRKQIQPEDVVRPNEPAAKAPSPASAPQASAPDPAPKRTEEIPQAEENVAPVFAQKSPRKRRSGVWNVALVVLVLALATVVLFLRGDLQVWKDKFLPGASGSAAVSLPDDPVPMPEASTTAALAVADSIPESEPVPVSEPVPPPRGNLYVQVASFRTMDAAERFCRELEADGFETLIEARSVSGVLWRRVLIGPYSDSATAQENREGFRKPEGENYFPIVNIESVSGS